MSILSHVSFQSCDSPPSDVWNILAVSITKSMFFKDSGIASNFKLKTQYTELILYICKKSLVLDSSNKYCRSRPLTKRSLLSACIYLSIKSNIVSHKAVKVLKDNNGLKCWRKTWNGPPKLNLLFNLTTVTSIAFVSLTHVHVHLNKFYACTLKKNPT